MCEKFEEKILLKRKEEKLEAEVTEHISMCPTCRILLKNSEYVDEFLERIDYIEPSNNFNQEVFRKIEKIEGEKLKKIKLENKFRFLQMTAASILFFLSLLLTGLNLNKTRKEIPYTISDIKQEKILEEVEKLAENGDINVLSTYDEWNINTTN